MHDQPTPSAPPRPRPDAVRAYGAMHTLLALERLAAGPRSSTELGEDIGIDGRSARRLLQRLAAETYAVQDAGHRRRYRATLRLAAVAGVLLNRSLLPVTALPVVAALARGGDRAAHLWVACGRDVFCVVHAGPGAVEPAVRLEIGEAASGEGDAAAVVLGAERERRQSCVYLRDECAAAVVDRGVVVAALGVTGDVYGHDLATVARAAGDVSAALAGACVSPRAPGTAHRTRTPRLRSLRA